MSSPQGAELKGAAWRALVSRYGEAAQLQEGDLYGFYTALDYQGSDWGVVKLQHQVKVDKEIARAAEESERRRAEEARRATLPGTIYVTSRQQDCDIYVDSKLYGKTPLKIIAKSGKYHVEVYCKKYLPFFSYVNVVNDNFIELKVKNKKIVGQNNDIKISDLASTTDSITFRVNSNKEYHYDNKQYNSYEYKISYNNTYYYDQLFLTHRLKNLQGNTEYCVKVELIDRIKNVISRSDVMCIKTQ